MKGDDRISAKPSASIYDVNSSALVGDWPPYQYWTADWRNASLPFEEIQRRYRGHLLASGSHDRRGDGVCLMEAVAWFAGEPHTDHPLCVCSVLADIGRGLNDCVFARALDKLEPFIPLLAGTHGSRELAQRRARLFCEFVLFDMYLPAQMTRFRSLTPWMQPHIVRMMGRMDAIDRTMGLEAAATILHDLAKYGGPLYNIICPSLISSLNVLCNVPSIGAAIFILYQSMYWYGPGGVEHAHGRTLEMLGKLIMLRDHNTSPVCPREVLMVTLPTPYTGDDRLQGAAREEEATV